jgi:glycosyltransferase involved in cell wall biosynthesis
MRRRGLQTRVITGFPNYPYGRIYKGFRWKLRQIDEADGVVVHRVPYFPSHERSALKRIASYLSFAASAAILGASSAVRSDVALVYSTPATAALPALVIRGLGKVPYVLYVADLWPDTVVESGMVREGLASRVMYEALAVFCNQVYRSATAITVTSEGMRDLLIDRGVPDRKVHVVHHWVDESIFQPVSPSPHFRSSLGLGDQFVAMYAGSMGDLQGLDVAIRAAHLLRDLTNFRLVLLGTGVAEPRLRELADKLGLTNVIFAGPRAPAEMASVMRAADVQLVTLRDLPLFHATIPSKVQAIMASACPIISSVPGDTGALVTESGAGLACPPEDSVALADALRQMHDLGPDGRRMAGLAGRRFYEIRLSESVGSLKLANLLIEAGT